MTRDELLKILGSQESDRQYEKALQEADRGGVYYQVGAGRDILTVFAAPAKRCCGFCDEAHDWEQYLK